MGLDLYIEAKITEKATGKCITYEKRNFMDNGYFCLICWDGFSFASLRNSLIEIANRYSKKHYTFNDYIIPFPQSALREICSCILSFACTPEEYRFELETERGYWDIEQRTENNNTPYKTEQHYEHISWDDKQSEENSNFENGNKLRQFIYELERITYENKFCSDDIDKYIYDKKDFIKFSENPQAYEWKFRIFNSY